MEDLVARLHAVDFFAAWPPDAVARAEAHIRGEERPPFFDDPQWPGLQVGSIHFDLETLDGPRRYVELLREFWAASFGLFHPRKITARRRGVHVDLRFEHLGEKHAHQIPWEEDSDWGEDELLDALWEACDDLPGPLHFHHIPDGQAGGFLLATDVAYDRAAAGGLPPRRAEGRRGRPRSADGGPPRRRVASWRSSMSLATSRPCPRPWWHPCAGA